MKSFTSALVLAAGLFYTTGAVAQNANAPEMSFESEVIDYGTIEKGANGQREFVFTNTGKEPLIITNAKGSCGCTVPTWPREPIAPGAKSSIKVKYDTNRVGPFTKTVNITSNAKTPSKTLTIKGNVANPAAAQPTVPVKETGSSAVSKK